MISKVLIAGGALASGAVADRPSLRKLSNDDFVGSVTVELSKMPPNLDVTDVQSSGHALTTAVQTALVSYLAKGDTADHLQNHIEETITATVSSEAGDVTIQGNKITLGYTIAGFSDTAYTGNKKTAYDLIETTLASNNEALSVKIAELATAPDHFEFARGFITPPAADLAGSVTLTFEKMPANLLPANLVNTGDNGAKDIADKVLEAIQKYADKDSEGGALQGSFDFPTAQVLWKTSDPYTVNGNEITFEFTLGGFTANTALDADKSDAYRTIRAAVSTAEEDHMAQHAFANSVACELVSELAGEDDWSVVCEKESSPTEKTSGSARVAVVSFAAAAVAGAALF